MSAPGITVARLCSACGQVRPCPPGAVGASWRCAECVAPALTDDVTDDDVRRAVGVYHGTPAGFWDEVEDSAPLEHMCRRLRLVLAADRAARTAGGARLREVVAQRDDMRARLEADAAAFVEQGRKLFDARLRTAEHAARLAEHEEAEAAVCPEDVGCIEYIGVLTRRVAELTAERDALARLAEDRRERLLLCAELFARSPWPEMLDQARAIRAEHGRGR